GGRRPAEVVRGRRAGIANADAPVIAGRRERKRIDPTRERLGLAAELRVDSAEALFVEKDTGVIAGAGVDPIPLAPPGANAAEERNFADGGIVLPTLTENPLSLRFRDVDFVLAATLAAAVTVPLLDDGQVPDRPAHDALPYASPPPSRC